MRPFAGKRVIAATVVWIILWIIPALITATLLYFHFNEVPKWAATGRSFSYRNRIWSFELNPLQIEGKSASPWQHGALANGDSSRVFVRYPASPENGFANYRSVYFKPDVRSHVRVTGQVVDWGICWVDVLESRWEKPSATMLDFRSSTMVDIPPELRGVNKTWNTYIITHDVGCNYFRFKFETWFLSFILLVAPYFCIIRTLLRHALKGKRRKAQCCVACGYSLHGNTSGRCPECGAVLKASPMTNPPV